MKKILLTLMLVGAFALVKAQVVLNELYAYPNGGNSEFIELYNSGAAENMDCYTIVSYWSSGANKGWYVLDLPSIVLGSQDFLVIGPAGTISVQGTAGVAVDVNWNSLPASGFLRRYTVSGPGYTITSFPPGSVTDFLVEGDFAPSQNTLTFLYKNGFVVNAFWGGGPSGTIDPDVTSMPDLAVTGATACSSISGVNGDFSTFTAVEFKNQAGGTDNGYAREFDGKCGSWDKTSSQATHTPGLPNGGAAGAAGTLTTSQGINCNVPRIATFQISGISAPITLADDFPVNVVVYNDVNKNGELDLGDTAIATKPLTNYGAAPVLHVNQDTVRLNGQLANAWIIFAYRTKRGCFDKVIAANTCAPLPVKFKSFNAARNHSVVALNWETASEQNNSGFAIERLIGAGGWQQIGFVSSKAAGGNSSSDLSYEYSDLNNTSAMTQYRLKQIDFDNKSSHSDIRAVRGQGQAGKTIVYPNPSNNGHVSVVFEDATATRDISLMDMSGRMIKQIKAVTNNNIQFDNLTPGVYSLRVINRETGDQVVEKIVVNNR
jgi:hypothetical protein